MKIDTNLQPTHLDKVADYAKEVEKAGFGTLWIPETKHDAFLPGVLIAEHTKTLQFGTSIAVGFARTPGNLAYLSWDLAQLSNGRFVLGLGTQVKAHIQRRFGMPWPDSVVKKMREQINSIRAIWNTWQTGERLNFRGDYYKITLMTPFFDPGPIDHPNIPIFIAGVNTGLASLAGETADGFMVHPLNSPKYLREVLLPAIARGANKNGRNLSDVVISTSVFSATNAEEFESIRQLISFYASTPSYRGLMRLHGWEDISIELSILARKSQWNDMPPLINDDIVKTLAIVSDGNELPELLHQRYDGLSDRVALYNEFVPGRKDQFWNNLVNRFR